jgi:hypothetical protein
MISHHRDKQSAPERPSANPMRDSKRGPGVRRWPMMNTMDILGLRDERNAGR